MDTFFLFRYTWWIGWIGELLNMLAVVALYRVSCSKSGSPCVLRRLSLSHWISVRLQLTKNLYCSWEEERLGIPSQATWSLKWALSASNHGILLVSIGSYLRVASLIPYSTLHLYWRYFKIKRDQSIFLIFAVKTHIDLCTFLIFYLPLCCFLKIYFILVVSRAQCH